MSKPRVPFATMFAKDVIKINCKTVIEDIEIAVKQLKAAYNLLDSMAKQQNPGLYKSEFGEETVKTAKAIRSDLKVLFRDFDVMQGKLQHLIDQQP